MKTSILWFRRDLRLHDNQALEWACENSDAILPVYIYCPEEEHPWPTGGASRWWLYNSLRCLEKELGSYGLRMMYFKGPSYEVLSRLVKKYSVSSIVFNRVYEPGLYKRDSEVIKKINSKVDMQAMDDNVMTVPGTVLNSNDRPYRIFTPYYKKVRQCLERGIGTSEYHGYVSRLKHRRWSGKTDNTSVDDLALLDECGWHEKFNKYWYPGEAGTARRLADFVDNRIEDYKASRDTPSIEGTSGLSPGLHFGEISESRIYAEMQPALDGAYGYSRSESAEAFLRQLIWRDFARQVLWHFPKTVTGPMDERYRPSFWRFNKKHFELWAHGNTGIPLIDAGMKQLWETGWMHNRVRMIVASFLTKNLGINWIDGARWFWDTLVDADLASNNLGWQWVAGCGVDAAPYYRIFNPVVQARRFDGDGAYIRSWAPEYSAANGPDAMVDIACSREKALERYKRLVK